MKLSNSTKIIVNLPPILIPFLGLLTGIISYGLIEPPYQSLSPGDVSILTLLSVLFLSIGISIWHYYAKTTDKVLLFIFTCAFYFCWAGTGYLSSKIESIEPENSIRKLDVCFIEIKGKVISELKENKYGKTFWIEADSIFDGQNRAKVVGKIVIELSDKISFFTRSTDIVVVQGKFTPIDIELSKGKSSGYFGYLFRSGIRGLIKSRKIYKTGRSNSLHSKLIHLRQYWEDALYSKMLSETEAGLGIALLLGEKAYLDEELKKSYINAGLAHILALSGSHIAVLVLALSGLMRISTWMASKIMRSVRLMPYFNTFKYLLPIIVLIAYMILTGLSPSVVRACIMGVAYLLAEYLWLKGKVTNIALLTAMGQMLYQPSILYDIGFILSYVALFGIIWMYPNLDVLFLYRIKQKINITKNSYLRYFLLIIQTFGEISLVTIAAQVAVLPIGIYIFGTTQTYFLLSNLLTTTLSIFAMWVGLLFLLISGIPFISDITAFIFEFLLRNMNTCTIWISKLPYAQISGLYISGFGLAVYYIFWFLICIMIMYFKNITEYRLSLASYGISIGKSKK